MSLLKLCLIIALFHQTTFAETQRNVDAPLLSKKDSQQKRHYKDRKPFGLQGKDFQSTTSKTLNSMSWSGGFSCLKDVVQGVWNSTGGTAEGLYGMITDPFAAWDQGVATYNFMYDFLADIETQMGEVLNGLENLDGDTIAAIVCTIVGEIGTAALITAFTSGATAPIVTAKAIKYVQKIKGLKSVLDLAKLGQIDSAQSERLNSLLRKFIRSDRTEIPADAQKNIELLTEYKQSTLAMDALECALDSADVGKPKKAMSVDVGKYCRDNRIVANDLDPKNIDELLNKGSIKNNEYTFGNTRWRSFDQARNFALELPALKKFKIDFWDRTKRTVYECRRIGDFAGKPCGWEIKNPPDFARIRLDNDPINSKKAHFNIEISRGSHRYKYVVQFDCNQQICTTNELEKFRKSLFK